MIIPPLTLRKYRQLFGDPAQVARVFLRLSFFLNVPACTMDGTLKGVDSLPILFPGDRIGKTVLTSMGKTIANRLFAASEP